MSQSPKHPPVPRGNIDPLLYGEFVRHSEALGAGHLCPGDQEDRQACVDAELDRIDGLLDMARDARTRGDDTCADEALAKLTKRYGLPLWNHAESV